MQVLCNGSASVVYDVLMESFASIVAGVYGVSVVSLNEKDLIVSLLQEHEHCCAIRTKNCHLARSASMAA